MLLVFLLLLKADVFGTQTVETKSMSVIEGDAVTLQTDLSEIQNDDTILWMFGPKDFLISQIKRQDDLTSFFVTDNVEFRGRLQVDQNTGSLTIRNTRIRHSGQYKLTISREKITFKVFNITVSVVVSEMDGIKSVPVSVMEGEAVTLHADSVIHQYTLMLWWFGDKGILLAKIDTEINETLLNNVAEGFVNRLQIDQTGSLTIKNTRKTDSGLYELQIRGSEKLQRFLISVLDPGLSSGVIAGIVCVCIFFLLLLIAYLIYYCHRISKLKRKMVKEKKETVMEGESVTLHAGLSETQGDITLKWCYETDDNLIAEIKGGDRRANAGADGRFRSKLRLTEIGDLTISNVRPIHSGLYKLKISSRGRKTKYMRFIVTVSVKAVSVTAGSSVTLQTNAKIQSDDLILWTLGAENLLVVKKDSGTTTVNKNYRGRLRLGKMTASLTISNITNTDSGHFKLQIINTVKSTIRRISVTVTGSTRNQVSELETVVMLLLHEDEVDGVSEQEETWSL
ncbi:hypothetical protein QQF64_034550 [Cirrhinus molitorella]|uniref:Immunoglobulin domain-containing protein n=1 Tax=Cirrhinus molitorella TaxID=172907 RepID=A0ABR3L127_9TELE